MANKKLGYIPLYRSLQDHWLWSNKEPFSSGQAWIDLLLSVNHDEKKLKVGCNLIMIKPGQMWTSYVKLANRWNWSKDRVSRYIKLLKIDEMITVDATPNGTLLTIVNWDNYRLDSNAHKDTNKDTDKDTIKDADKDANKSQTINIKNIENEENLKIRTPAPPNDGGEWQ